MRRPCLPVVLVALLAAGLGAQDGPRVGTRVSPPFVLSADPASGEVDGLAIDLWREVAARVPELAGEPRWSVHDVPGLLAVTAAGEVDLAVAALTVTSEREEDVDFALPFLSSGLGIAVRGSGEAGFLAVLTQVFSWELLRAIGALGLVLLVFGALMWLFERRRNAEQFGGARGIGEGFWWSAVTMTTVGYGDRAPITPAGRVVALVWMFASIVIISSYTASIASALTVSSLQSTVQGREDLPHVRVASVAATSSGDWLDAEGIAFRNAPDVQTALERLAAGEVDAVVYDRPMLRYLARTAHQGELEVLPELLREDHYAFALPPGSPLREEVNRALAGILASEPWRATRRRYLGAD